MSDDDAGMTIRGLRAVAVVGAILALVLPAAANAGSSAKFVDEGVVQSVGQGQLVLKALDGSVLTFTVTAGTKVRLNGTPAAVTAIAPGFVATVVHDKRAVASQIRAFGTLTPVTARGVVAAVTPRAITVRVAGGATLTLKVDRTTRFRFKGQPVGRGLARPGATVAITHAADQTALVVNVLKRPGA